MIPKKLLVTLVMNSGRLVHFFAGTVTATKTNENKLTGIETEEAAGWPIYIRLDDVSSIYTRRVPFWARLPR